MALKSWSKEVDGNLWPATFPEKNYYLMRDLPLRQDDVIISTFPKCGTHWISYILWKMLYPSDSDKDRMYTAIPFVDLFGLGRFENVESGGRTLATHMPADWIPKCASAKYVVIIRNPFDCCVSYFHHMKSMSPPTLTHEEIPGIPEDFFDGFVAGEMPYCSYFHHLKSWLAVKDEPNVHLAVFEDLKVNLKEEIRRLARFLNHDRELEANNELLLNKLVEESSFAFMKEKSSSFAEDDQTHPEVIMRKGLVGGFADSLTSHQVEKLRLQMEKEIGGTQIFDYWSQLMFN